MTCIIRSVCLVWLGFAATSVLMLTACGKSTEAEVAEPLIPPHQASASALLQRVNELQTSDPIRLNELLDLMYAENEAQEELITLMRDAMPFAEMEQAAWEQFGQLLTDVEDEAPLGPENPATMVEQDGPRAKAEYSRNGSDETIYFVRIADEWWISGYTLEYSRDFDVPEEEKALVGKFFRNFQGSARQLTRRIQNGEFETIFDARAAFHEQVQKIEDQIMP